MIVKKSLRSPRNKDSKGKKPLKPVKQKKFRLYSKTFFLTFKGFTETGERLSKSDLADFLLKRNPKDRSLYPEKYLLCEQSYESGEPHFHVILCYSKRKQICRSDHFDYLGIHPNIQTMRNMKAALQYVHKQDPNPLTNMDVAQQRRVALASNTRTLYQLLQQQMKKDPFHFNLYGFLKSHNLANHVYHTTFAKAAVLLRHMQQVQCQSVMQNKPGFRFIDRSLIRSKLSSEQLAVYDSWDGYQVIVDHLNQIVTLGFRRPLKTSNLLITGLPNSGKTSLVQGGLNCPYNCLERYVSVYPMGTKTWWPNYKSQVYSLLFWNQAKLSTYSYDTVLRVLEGSKVDLPYKGGSVLKYDNPLVIMTSNMTLKQMIRHRFPHDKDLASLALTNLSARITNVIVPDHLNLFLLQKLFVYP